MSHIIGICPLAIQQEAQDGMGGIYYIKPGAESLTLTLQDDILTLQNIADKLGIHPIVTLRKARTVGMTQTGLAITTSASYSAPYAMQSVSAARLEDG